MFERIDWIYLHSEERPVSAARCPETALLYQYWLDIRAARFAPAWRDIDLLTLPTSVVPKVMVVDVLLDPVDFVYRFFGTWHVQCHNRDMTGHKVTDFKDPTFTQIVLEEYTNTYERREPVLFQLENTLNHIHYLSELLRLPLSSDGETIDSIMVLESLIDDPATAE